MPRRISLPRICIALGFPETETLLAHARREFDAGERFFVISYQGVPKCDGLSGEEQVVSTNRSAGLVPGR